tara:strand:- start:323 stop:1318 length:996 start_codon:yes stop_codon:yes gene_type:complete
MNKKALIFGISGQDGAFLSELLLKKGYEVHGTSRDAEMKKFSSIIELGIKDEITFHSVALSDFRSTLKVIEKVSPNEIYNLAGQSSVGLSFEKPLETLESIVNPTINILESMRFLGNNFNFFNAGSSESFGDTGNLPANETTPFRPRSPYGVAKASAFWQVLNYRESYGLFASTGIMFNHESNFRSARFVTRKIVQSAARIALGSKEKLVLGDLSIKRDWGWAPEYVDAMWRILQQDIPDDYVIATGIVSALEEFVEKVFSALDLKWEEHVTSSNTFYRPSEIKLVFGSSKKAKEKLNWSATKLMPDVASLMALYEFERLKKKKIRIYNNF